MALLQPGNQYKFVWTEIYKSVIVKKTLNLTPTKDNIIYPSEVYKDYENYECVNEYGERFVCYINLTNKYCQIKSDIDPNNEKEHWFGLISNIYIANTNIIVFQSNIA